MTERILLSVEDAIEIHEEQIQRFGGSSGIRDLGLLESALHAACATFGGHFLHDDLFDMAAAYLFYLVKNHAFIDGNKRVRTAAALVFLDLNGVEIREDEPALSDLVLDVAQDKAKKAEVANYLRIHTSLRRDRP